VRFPPGAGKRQGGKQAVFQRFWQQRQKALLQCSKLKDKSGNAKPRFSMVAPLIVVIQHTGKLRKKGEHLADHLFSFRVDSL
jgi:hypothetical protein